MNRPGSTVKRLGSALAGFITFVCVDSSGFGFRVWASCWVSSLFYGLGLRV